MRRFRVVLGDELPEHAKSPVDPSMKLWLRPIPFALLAAFGLTRLGRAPVDDAAPNRSAALCGALASQAIACREADVVWLSGPSGVSGAMRGGARAIVRGREKDEETADLFLVPARLSPEGHLLDVGEPANLTRSPADESLPVVHGTLAAFVASVDGVPGAVNVLDLAGHDRQAYEELSSFQRTQVKVADWQATGQARGIKRTVFGLVPPPRQATLSFRDDGILDVKTDARPIVLDPTRGAVLEGAQSVRANQELVSKPPTFGPWMSDRLRAASWFGDDRNQILKAVVFTTLEWVKNKKAALTGDTGEKDVAEDMGTLNATRVEPSTFTDPEIGWPPKPLTPILKPPMSGEGQWVTLDKDAFITPIPGVTAPFVTTFVRADASAQQTRVYITLWDPRLIALHMEAGTVEPVGATGEAGPGQIPRTPEMVRHVVAGFNGGFQATHGEFGMQVNGHLYLPPKPYGATVMELRDGSTAFGAWPRDPGVPDDVLSYRQNMTALVQNEKWNPWGRAWWGGVPPGWHDAIHTTRSGLCLTRENFVAYFWGNDIGPEPLGRAMVAARCQFGIHLDMNPGLAGFEFYNVAPSVSFQPLGRPLQADWEYEGTVKDMPEFKFRSRRMIKSMGHILFPRYIQRDGRDFFYLTTRSVLPGAPIEADAVWRTKGLPQHGYPYASAITALRLAGTDKRVRVLRVDPRTVRGDAPATVEPAPLPEPGAHGGRDAGRAAHDGGAHDAGARVARDAGGHDGPEARDGRDAGADACPNGSPCAAKDKPADPTVVVFAKPPRIGGKRDAGAGALPIATDKRLWIGPHLFAIDKAMPGGIALVDVVPVGVAAGAGAATATGSGDARAAVGISDEDGMLQWIELLPEDKPDAATSDAMLKLLERIGCSSRALVVGDVRAFLGGSLDVGGDPAPMGAPTARLLRTPSPGGRPFFEGTEIVPQSVWQPLQAQKVKWRPTLAPPDKPAASGSASAAPPPSKPPR